MNRLILGDNLEVLKGLPLESVDLIYLDPPFFSNRNYEVIWGDDGEVRSFKDRWSGGMDHYINWLKERVEIMYRILKPTGSLFLHCDYHANSYIRVFILDKIFGEENFNNEIIWKRTNTPKGSQFANRTFGIVSDSIFWYSKTKKYFFDDTRIREKLDEDSLLEKYPKEDQKGRYYEYPILRSASKGARKNLVYEYNGYNPPYYGWVVSRDKLIEIDNRGDLGWRKNGNPFRKFRPHEDPGKLVSNVWDDILRIQSNSKESIGYPTQKPEALLERIIKMASNEGDTILDPFLGGGTTIAMAEKLNRNWIGIDQSPMALKVSELRLQKEQNLFSQLFAVQLYKYDYDTLRYSDAFQFESWIIEQFGGTPNSKQRGDSGIDGKDKNGMPIQVKRSDNIGRNVIDNFLSAISRFDKNMFESRKTEKLTVGTIIAFSFGKGAIGEVARLKHNENIILDLVLVENIVPIAQKPELTLTFEELSKDENGLREIKFIANAKSESGIEFFAWDFNFNEVSGFKAEIIIDKTGEQVKKFARGEHLIAVKVIDNDGLENIEKLKIQM